MKFTCCSWVAAALLLVACGPSEKQKAMYAEEKRVHCLNHWCEGDIEPSRDALKEVALKLNGQWFIGPKEYFSNGMNGAWFNWWDHKPLSSEDAQAVAGKGYDFLIEIFLSHHDGVMHGPNRYPSLQQAEAAGRLISKSTPRPGLEVWRVREIDGRGSAIWYVATDHVDKDPNGAVLNCDDGDPKFDSCRTAFIWQPGIGADMRFRAKHGPDWPEIYQETTRILQLLKKA